MPTPSYQQSEIPDINLNKSAGGPGTPRVYSGAWRQTSGYVDRALPPAPGVDIAHAFPDMRDPGQVPAGYPRVDYPPTFLTEPSDETYNEAADTPGMILDFEPRAHDVGDPDTIQIAPMPGTDEPPPRSLAHLLDRGAVAKQLFAPPTMRASDELWWTGRWEQGEVQTGSVTASLRGANSLPVNNPEGFRLGWSVKRNMNREMFHNFWPHTERIMQPAGAAKAVDSPAMTAAQSNRYTSPFAWRSFSGGRAQQFPLLRRQPPDSWDVDQTNDGLGQASDIPGDWVVD
jgi:hypothetical protein